MRAHVPDLFVQRGFGDLTFLDVLDQSAIPSNETDVQPLFRLVPLAANHHAIAVSERFRTRNHGRDDFSGKFPDAFKQVGNLLLFETELRVIRQVLVLAAAARAKVRATRLHTFGGRLNHAEQPGTRKILLHLAQFRFHHFPGNHERNEHDEIVNAPDTFTAEGHVGNLQRQFLAGTQIHRISLGIRRGPQKSNWAID